MYSRSNSDWGSGGVAPLRRRAASLGVVMSSVGMAGIVDEGFRGVRVGLLILFARQ